MHGRRRSRLPRHRLGVPERNVRPSDYCSGKIWGIARADYGKWAYQELLDTGLLMTGAGEDEAGNVYFTSCLCGYGRNAPHREGAVWMLVSADQVPEGATTAPPDRSPGESTPAAGEGISSPEAATPEG